MNRILAPALASLGFVGIALLGSCGGGGGGGSTFTPPVTPGLATVNFQMGGQIVAEGGADLQLIVQLTDLSPDTITVPFSVAGSATSGFDYIISASPLVITPGEGGAIIQLTILADALFEVDETIEISLGTPINAKLGVVSVHTTTVILGSGEIEPNNSAFDANEVGAMEPGTNLDITGRVSAQGMLDSFDVFNFIATSDTIVGIDLVPQAAADIGILISDENGAPHPGGVVNVSGIGATESTAVMAFTGQVFNIAVYSLDVTTDYTLTVSGAIPLLSTSDVFSTAAGVDQRGLSWEDLVAEQLATKQLPLEQPIFLKRSRTFLLDGETRRRADLSIEPGR
jgi:hypothetical protein